MQVGPGAYASLSLDELLLTIRRQNEEGNVNKQNTYTKRGHRPPHPGDGALFQNPADRESVTLHGFRWPLLHQVLVCVALPQLE